jgi:hypothetical protein
LEFVKRIKPRLVASNCELKAFAVFLSTPRIWFKPSSIASLGFLNGILWAETDRAHSRHGRELCEDDLIIVLDFKCGHNLSSF